MERWLPKADSHPLAKREADLTLLLAKNGEAWEKYGQILRGLDARGGGRVARGGAGGVLTGVNREQHD